MKFERDYFVHYYDADQNKRAMITSIMRYFEDIAVLQSEQRNIGLDYYALNKVAWVIYKWDITIHSYPCFKDNIKVITDPRGFERFYASRTFEIRDSNGDCLAEANSIWFFVNTELRRPTKITADMYTGYAVDEETEADFNIIDPRAPEKIDGSKEFSVRLSDIDTNEHVNNIKYVEWALEAIPHEIIKEKTLKKLKVVYKKETRYGSMIQSLVEVSRADDIITCLHAIKEENSDLCLLETTWQ